jgi:hypothetical protein
MSEGRLIWKPGTLPNAHLVWMSVLDATARTGKRDDGQGEDQLSFWLRTCAVCIVFSAAISGASVALLIKLTGG